ncbi:hypothetical protein U9M48_009121 [Paspalum notatum var. saurae]|uniref:Uncharacterized protein n=1 Tax=Paspalum notatum var. saurae TaxID=547442 RepID=A0AAQ3WEJ7_PASNO
MPSILHAAAAPSFLSTRGNSRTSITFPRYPQAAMGFSLSPIASSKEAARASSSMGAPLLLQASSTPPRPRRAMPCNFPDVAAPRRSDFPRQFPSAWGFLLGVDARVPAFQAAGAAPHRSSSSRRSFARHDFPLINARAPAYGVSHSCTLGASAVLDPGGHRGACLPCLECRRPTPRRQPPVPMAPHLPRQAPSNTHSCSFSIIPDHHPKLQLPLTSMFFVATDHQRRRPQVTFGTTVSPRVKSVGSATPLHGANSFRHQPRPSSGPRYGCDTD